MRARQWMFSSSKKAGKYAEKGSAAMAGSAAVKRKYKKHWLLFLGLYSLGAVLCILLLNGQAVPGKEAFLQYLIRQRTEPSWPVTFSTSFMAQLLQILALAFCGCCTIGFVLVPVLFFCKGAAGALFWLAWVQSYAWQGLYCYWALFWLPDALLLCGALFVAHTAQQASRRLSAPTPQLRSLQSRLLNRTIFTGLGCIPCSGLSVLLAFVFVRFLGL